MRINTRQLRRSMVMVLAATTAAAGPLFLSPASAAGGTFVALNSGTFKIISCTPSAPCSATLAGRGGAAFFGPTTEAGNLQVTIKLPCSPASGTLQLTSVLTPTNSISATVAGQFCLQQPITAGLKISMKYTVHGGTGAFVNATGTGIISGTAILNNGTYKDLWYGTLNY